MPAHEHKPIKLDEFTERELLMQLHYRMDKLDEKFEKFGQTEQDLRDRMTKMETKLGTVAGIALFLSTVASAIISLFIKLKS